MVDSTLEPLKAIDKVGSDLEVGFIILCGSNAIVLILVIGGNVDDSKHFWETFWHAFPIGLMVLAFMLVVEMAIMALLYCCAGVRSRIDGFELAPLSHTQHDAGGESKV